MKKTARCYKKAFKEAGAAGKTALVLGSWFGSGLAPLAPGTSGTLAGLPLVLVMGRLGGLRAAIFVLVFIALSVWAAEASRRILAGQDPPVVVIDEVAGFLVALLLVPLSVATACLGFVLFRAFDVFKPYPIKKLERLGGGVGIVADDILAGVYANLSLRALLFFVQAG